jgi:hypothetical protein
MLKLVFIGTILRIFFVLVVDGVPDIRLFKIIFNRNYVETSF